MTFIQATLRTLKRKTPLPPEEISGVRVKPSLRAKHLSLRRDVRTGEVVLVFPLRASESRARSFIEKNRRWIERQRSSPLLSQKIRPQDTIMLHGREHIVAHKPGRGITRIEDGRIVVRGDATHFSRRLGDFLKMEAERTLTEAARKKTERLNLPIKRVTIRDPKTRWGSCGQDGQLMFSWRLILAPPDVTDYVVAHEVAHRLHMNHGKKFWALCASLTRDASGARRWLKQNGHGLMLMAFDQG